MPAALDLIRKHIPASTDLRVRRRGDPKNWFTVEFSVQKATSESADEIYAFRRLSPIDLLTGYMLGTEIEKDCCEVFVRKYDIKKEKKDDPDSEESKTLNTPQDFLQVKVPNGNLKIVSEHQYKDCEGHLFPHVREISRSKQLKEKLEAIKNTAFISISGMIIIGELNEKYVLIPTDAKMARLGGFSWSEPNLSEKIFGLLDLKVPFSLASLPDWEIREHSVEECLTWENKLLRLCAYDYVTTKYGQQLVLKCLGAYLLMRDKATETHRQLMDTFHKCTAKDIWSLESDLNKAWKHPYDGTEKAIDLELRGLLRGCYKEHLQGPEIRTALGVFEERMKKTYNDFLSKFVAAEQWRTTLGKSSKDSNEQTP